MHIKRFSFVFAIAGTTSAAAMAAPLHAPAVPDRAAPPIVFVQSVKERDLQAVPPVDAGRDPAPPARTGPPPPPPVPPAPRLSNRKPPPATDDSAPPAREVPPPPTSTSRYTPPPPPPQEPAPRYQPAPRVDAPPAPPARRADTPRRAPPQRSTFYANCTQQCHLSCEASFEVCNGDSSPAKPACVQKLEACRVERCACRLD